MVLIKNLSVRFYQEISGNEPVRKWLLELSNQDRKIIGHDIRVTQKDWNVAISKTIIKSLGNGLWEIRSNLDNRIARILCTIYHGEILLLHGFIKKTQKTPCQAIDIAKKRMKTLEE